MPLVNLRIDAFQNDEHCENWTRSNKYELFDLVGRLALELNMHVHNSQDNFFSFHREEILTWTLVKLVHGLPHAAMSDMVVGGNSIRWGAGYNHLMKYLDNTLANIVNMNSLNL